MQQDAYAQRVAFSQQGGYDEDEGAGCCPEPDEYVTSTVPPDVYGGFLAIYIRGMKEQKYLSVLFGGIWVVFNLALQGYFIRIWFYYIMPRKHSAYGDLDTLQNYTTRIKYAMHNDLPLEEDLIDLCRRQPVPGFFGVCLLLWTMRMMGEFSGVRTMMMQLSSCPTVYLRGHTTEDKDGLLIVTGLMPFDGVLLGLGLCVPKFVMTLCLWIIGADFLVYSHDMEKMIVNIMALHFICSIQTHVYNGFLSHSKREWISHTQLVQKRGPWSRFWLSWPGELGKLVATFLFVVAADLLLFRTFFRLRRVCWIAAKACDLQCSRSLGFCAGHRDGVSPWP